MTMLDRMRRHRNWLKWSLGLVVLATNLLGDSLRFVRSAMQTLSDLISPHASYGQNGQVRGRNAGGKVIQGQI